MPSGTKRVQDTFTGPPERRLLHWLCARMPSWIAPDTLTLIGVFGAALAFLGYVWSSTDPAGFWLAVFGIVLNWFGDSLDGSLARYRRRERPHFGFFIDHVSDTLAIALITLGMGFSPYVRMESAFAALGAYYVLVILTMTTCVVTGTFRISYQRFGPTEMRLILIAGTLAALLHAPVVFAIHNVRLSVFDAGLGALVFGMLGASMEQALRVGRALARADPAPEPASGLATPPLNLRRCPPRPEAPTRFGNPRS